MELHGDGGDDVGVEMMRPEVQAVEPYHLWLHDMAGFRWWNVFCEC